MCLSIVGTFLTIRMDCHRTYTPGYAVGDRGGSLERDLARTTFSGTLSDAFTTCTLHNSNGGFFRHCVIAASSEHSAIGVTHQLHCVWHCRLTHCRISQPVRTPQLQRYQKLQLLLISCRPGIRIAFLVLRTSPRLSHLLQVFLWFYAPGGTCAAVLMGNAVRFDFKAGVSGGTWMSFLHLFPLSGLSVVSPTFPCFVRSSRLLVLIQLLACVAAC
jgi:hypothetical protein